jgi:hypothetical protein
MSAGDESLAKDITENLERLNQAIRSNEKKP